MKHVFITHSNVTKIIVEGIIEDLRLPVDEVLIVSFRNSFIDNYQNIDLEGLRKKHLYLFQLPVGKLVANVKSIKGAIKEVDNKLQIAEDFILYTPQVSNPFFQIIGSHKRCLQINFLEEGTASYFWTTRMKNPPIQAKIVNRIIFANRLPSCSYFDSASFHKKKPSEYFIFSAGAFETADRKRKVVINPTLKTISDYAIVFVLDAIVEFKIGTMGHLLEVMEKFKTDIAGEKICIKFHPQQNLDMQNKILSVFDGVSEIEIIPSDVILEKEFLCERQGKLSIFGIMSSLLIYAKQAGHEVTSYLPFIKNNEAVTAKVKKLYEAMNIEMKG